MRKLAVILFFVLSGLGVYAQNREGQTSFNLRVESRASLTEAGFKAERLSFALGGDITDKLSYYVFHNFHKPITASDLMAATDQAYLRFKMNEHLWFRAGKFPINIGSWEYDAAPIDIYYYTRMFLVANFFQPGVEAVYILPTDKDALEFQICRSMEASDKEFNLFTFSASWRGNWGFFKPLYSLNVSQLSAHAGIRYDIALGNQFLYGPFKIELDLINRYYSNRGTRFMESFAACFKGLYGFRPWMDLIVKANFDNEPLLYRESHLLAGCECYPVKGSRDVRIHAMAGARLGDNPGFIGTMGVKWNVNLIKAKK